MKKPNSISLLCCVACTAWAPLAVCACATDDPVEQPADEQTPAPKHIPTQLSGDTPESVAVTLTQSERDMVRHADALPTATARRQARREAADRIVAARAREVFGSAFDDPSHSNEIARMYSHVHDALIEQRTTPAERAEVEAQLAEGARQYTPTQADLEAERAIGARLTSEETP